MNKKIFVTATNTDIGKTYTSKLLLKAYALKGYKVGAIKLIETGVKEFAPDANTLLQTVQKLNKDFLHLSVKDIVPITYELAAAPYIASKNKALALQDLDKAVSNLEALCDILIIEGAGGLYVPIDEKYMMIDMISHFEATALLVTHCSLGCINDTLLSQKALKDRDIKYLTAFNCREEDESFSVVSEPYFKATGQKVLKTTKDIDTICDVLYNL
jgi:dethiobiotin synthetase